jgi:hypothetical protein
MRESRPIDIAALALASLVLAVTFLATRGLPLRVDAAAPEASGRFLAREAIRQLEPGGTLAVIVRDTDAFDHPQSRIQFDAFKHVLRRARTPISLVRPIQLDPLRPLEAPPGDFLELIRKATPGSVIVSFMGPPLLPGDLRAQLGAAHPRILAFCPGPIPEQVDLRQLFDAGLLHAALIDRSKPGPGSAQGSDPDRAFERFYRLVTPANVGALYQAAAADTP